MPADASKKFRAGTEYEKARGKKANTNLPMMAEVGNGDGATFNVAARPGNFYWIRLLDDDNRLTQCYSMPTLAYGDVIYVARARDRKLSYYEFVSFIQHAGGGVGPPLPAHDILSVAHSDAAVDVVSQGSIIVGNATPAWDELVVGGARTFLQVNAGGTDPAWTAFDWDLAGLAAGADMVHDHSAALEGGQDLRQIQELEFDDATVLTIDVNGTVTRTQVAHEIAANAGVADNLDQIDGGVEGDLLIIEPDTGDTITVRHNAGGAGDNIWLAGGADIVLDNDDSLVLRFNGTWWCDLSGGAGAGAAHNILSATHLDSAAAACVVGDVITGQAGPAWTKLAIGTQGFFFKADAGTTPSWVRISTQTCTVGPGTTCEASTLSGVNGAIALVNAAGPPTAANPWVILMYGGVYTETANITVPSYCWIIGQGEGTQINMGTGNDITFSADSGMESCYVYGNPTTYLLGTLAAGVVWRNVRVHLTSAGNDLGFYMAGSADVELWHCVADNGSTGFYLEDGRAYLYGCEAYGHSAFGLDTAGTAEVTTRNCDFHDNTLEDVYILGTTTWHHSFDHSPRTYAGGTIESGYTHWPNGEYFDLDLTGTDWDTKAECNMVGLRFSDTATPFPTTLAWPVSGTWAHGAGNGWAPTITVNAEGPAILVPIMRPGNWELFIGFEFTPSNIDERFQIMLGYLTNSNHVGAYGRAQDNSVADSDLDWHLSTNDGDDTWTVQYSGAAIAGASGNYQIGFRCQNGCVGVYDDQDNAWHYYSGRQSAGLSFTAAHAFLQFYRYDANVPTLYVRNLKLTYLL